MTTNNGREALLSDPTYLGKLVALYSRRNDALGLPAIEYDPTKGDLLDGFRREVAEMGQTVLIASVADTLHQAIHAKRKRMAEIVEMVRGGKVSIDVARKLLHEADVIKDEIQEFTEALQQIDEGLNRGA